MAHDILNFPDGLLSSGDPVPENPFPANDPLQELWRTATSEAEEELKRLNSERLETRPDAADRGLAWWGALVIGKFDVWAKRGVKVVWNKDALREYDQWLTRYARSWLVAVRDFHTPEIPVDELLSEMRTSLIGRIEFWKAEARLSVNKTLPSAPKTCESADSETGETEFATTEPTIASDTREPTDRRRSIDKYIEEVLVKTHKRITRKDIWMAAGYTTRTQFERWQRRAPEATHTADQKFRRVLREKPHLNPEQK
jgi:hypothetical protein